MYKVLLLPGDGVGREIMAQAGRILTHLSNECGLRLELEEALVGGSAYDQCGNPLPEETLQLARSAHAILLGAVGGPEYKDVAWQLRPERGLLQLRTELDLFANLRPATLYDPLAAASSLRSELITGLDVMIVRELTGGIYFGEPRGMRTLDTAFNRGLTPWYMMKARSLVSRR